MLVNPLQALLSFTDSLLALLLLSFIDHFGLRLRGLGATQKMTSYGVDGGGDCTLVFVPVPFFILWDLMGCMLFRPLNL